MKEDDNVKQKNDDGRSKLSLDIEEECLVQGSSQTRETKLLEGLVDSVRSVMI